MDIHSGRPRVRSPDMSLPARQSHRLALLVALTIALLAISLRYAERAAALGDPVAVVGVDVGQQEPRPNARQRFAWALRKRTSIETVLRPGRTRLDEPGLFDSPLLYWSGEGGFAELSDAEISGLRRFVEFGGFVIIDDAHPEEGAFDASVRRALARAFPDRPLAPVPADHTVFRSFYLLDRPVGRVRGPEQLEAIQLEDRLAVVYTRHDLGGALARDDLGTWLYPVTPGGDDQREQAHRLAVNLVMYGLCLDYKDDQVHAPFLMRRRGGRP